MKVWICYLFLSDSEYAEKRGIMDFMMQHQYDEENNLWKFVYGHTTDKKIFKAFMKIHNSKKFHTEKVTMSSEEHARFYSDNRVSEIGLQELEIAFETTVSVPMTSMESVYSIDYRDESSFEMLSEFTVIHPCIFRRKYQDALLDIGYTVLFYSGYATEFEESDYFFYNDSYRDRPKVSINTLGMYWFLYKDFISIDALRQYIIEEGDKR